LAPTPAPKHTTSGEQPAAAELPGLGEQTPIRLDLKTAIIVAAALLSIGGTWVVVKVGIANAETVATETKNNFTQYVERNTNQFQLIDSRLSIHDLKIQALELQNGSLEKRFDRLERIQEENKKELLDAIKDMKRSK